MEELQLKGNPILGKVHNKKGASVVFSIVGFMFAAMISLVVVNAAYSAATRVKKQKYDEQAFLLAQSMSGIIINALAGSGENAQFPAGKQLKTPANENLKYDGLTINYQFIENTSTTDGTTELFYNSTDRPADFDKDTSTDAQNKKTFYTVVKGATGLSDAEKAVQKTIYDMAKKIDQKVDTYVEGTLTTSYPDTTINEAYSVVTDFSMDSSYNIKAVTTATVKVGGSERSNYIVRMDAHATVRSDKYVCAGVRTGNRITVDYSDTVADGTGEELIKITNFSVTWPPDQINTIYVAP